MTNPYAAPTDRPIRVPPTATGDLWGMRSTFPVGPHTVEIETTHWSGSEIYRIEGVEQIRKRNLGWHVNQDLDVGRYRLQVRARWYPFFPVTVRLDGEPFIDDAFPQLSRLKRVIFVVSAIAMGILTASIVWDLARWMGWMGVGSKLLADS